MNIIRYDEIAEQGRRQVWSSNIADVHRRAMEGLRTYYKNDEQTRMFASIALGRQLSNVLYSLDGEFCGKTILDLGCGNRNFVDAGLLFRTRNFEPWLCRGLQVLGAKPIGVDYNCLDGETFEHYSVDLADEDCLNMIADHSVDVANASALFDSPFLKSYLFLSSRKLKQNIITQLERVLKPEGAFVYDATGLLTFGMEDGSF